MKSKKSIAMLLVAVLMILSLMTGCGGQKVRNEEQIKEDLIEQGVNVVSLGRDDVILDITDLNIDRRRTEGDYDEVYVTVQMENETYKVDEEYTLFYTYYDEGGWYLEDWMMNDYHSTAKKSFATDENFLAYASNYFTSCEIKERNQGTDENGNFTEEIVFFAQIEYECWTANFEGIYYLAFMDDIWIEECNFTAYNIDWSPLKGSSWTYSGDALDRTKPTGVYGSTTEEITLNITDVTESSNDYMSLSYSGHVYGFSTGRNGQMVEWVNESFSEEDDSVLIIYKTEEIMGNEVRIPEELSGLRIPWADPSRLFLDIHRDNGVCSYTEEYFAKM